MIFDINKPVPPPDQGARDRAQARQQQLTKPQGSLGRLEDIAIDFAGWQRREIPELNQITLRIFAGDHGVTAQGISAFPAEVTGQMIHNFCAGGAAISVLAKEQQCDFEVWNLGTIEPTPSLPALKNIQIALGTKDFSTESAMTSHQLNEALQAGADSIPEGTQLFVGGEMGIGNTTSASALMAALFNLSADEVAGSGTGLDQAGVAHKAKVVTRALLLHMSDNPDPLQLLERLGGLEIAALVGAYLHCAQNSVPVLVDGFIASVAAAYAIALNPSARHWMLFGHCSAEQAHKLLLEKLDVKPLLNLEMRLGEGSGAATAIPLIKSALALHAGMATFDDASVSEGA